MSIFKKLFPSVTKENTEEKKPIKTEQEKDFERVLETDALHEAIFDITQKYYKPGVNKNLDEDIAILVEKKLKDPAFIEKTKENLEKRQKEIDQPKLVRENKEHLYRYSGNTNPENKEQFEALKKYVLEKYPSEEDK